MFGAGAFKTGDTASTEPLRFTWGIATGLCGQASWEEAVTRGQGGVDGILGCGKRGRIFVPSVMISLEENDVNRLVF